MNAKTVLAALDSAYRNDVANVKDPGSAGTFQIENKGIAVVEVVTAGAENRALPAAAGLGVGTELVVCFKTDGGDLTVTGAESNVVLQDAGDVAVFRVGVNGANNVWRLMQSSAVNLASSDDIVTRATAAAGANLVPVSAGANKALKVATPIDITGDLSAYNEVTLKALLTALAGFGLITDSTTT